MKDLLNNVLGILSVVLVLTGLGNLSTTSVIIPTGLVVDYVPNPLTICVPDNLRDDAEWAAKTWNDAVAFHRTLFGLAELDDVRLEVVNNGCFIQVITFNQNPWNASQEGGWFSLNVNRTTYRILGGIIGVWNTSDVSVRRAILLHEFGHALGAMDMTLVGNTFKKPIMTYIDPANPQTEVTFLDVYNLWLQRAMRNRCHIKCPSYYVMASNHPTPQIILTAVTMIGLVAADFFLPERRDNERKNPDKN